MDRWSIREAAAFGHEVRAADGARPLGLEKRSKT